MGHDVTRTFALNGDRLTLTSTGIEAHQRAATRAPSLIVYTPSGYVGVYFPRGERDMLDQAPRTKDRSSRLFTAIPGRRADIRR